MILFAAHYPDKLNEQEGMSQRISSIDSIFQKEDRVYLVAFFNPFDFTPASYKRINEKVEVYRLNIARHDHYKKIVELVDKAEFVYVHSLYYSRGLLPLYDRNIFITDMHGVVPEEEAYKGNVKLKEHFDAIEKKILQKSDLIITVTNSMLKHYKHKYKDVDFKALVLPIIDKNIEGDEVDLNRNTKSVIYAGGVQNWQNIDAMIGSIKKNVDKYKFTILTPNIAEFESKLKASGIASNVVLKSVPRPQVSSYYKESDYGYILRDNSIVNKVACPTKLIEYMSYGVVPIVLNEEMGDFKTFGYSFLSLNNFDQTTDVDVNRLVEMRKNNLHVIKRIKALFSSSKEFLINYKPVKIGFKRNNNYLVCFGQIFFEFLIKKIRQYSR